jgi:hypothetical protein
MRINPAGNVGIGTTSPTSKLHVWNDKIEVTGFPAAGSPFTFLESNYNDQSAVAIKFLNYNPSNGYDSDLGIQLMNTGGSMFDAMIIKGSSGNVGIGTNSPTQLLTVNGAAGYLFTAQENSSNNVRFQVYVDANETSLVSGYNTTAKPMTFYVSSSERMRIGTNGAMKFNAYGSGTFTGTATQKLAVDSSGNVIEIPIGAGPVDGSGTANYITRWVDTDTITTSSIYETGGNIGIGTTSPLAKLSVGNGSISDANVPIQISSEGNGTQKWIGVNKNGSYGLIAGYVEDGGLAGNGAYIRQITSDPLYFAVNSTTTAMSIISSGNVGIGTTSPAYKLSVVGKIALNDGGNSVFIGTNAGLSDDATANINVGIGQNALQNNVSGSQNVAIGNNTLVANTNSNNTAVGSNSLQFSTTSVNNTAFGSFALNANTVGSSSIAVGAAALLSNTIGNHNTAVGNSAIRSNVSGSQNVGVGGSVLFNNTNGSDNVALGWNAARYFGTGTSSLTDTSGSIFIGSLARANASGEVNQIVIGMNALGLGSNTVVLGNDNVTTTALKGNVGIGTTSPYSPLQVGSYSGTGGYSYGTAATFVSAFSSTLSTIFIGSTDNTSTQDKGGSLDFGGGSEASSTPYTFARIKGYKEVSGGGYSGYLAFCTTPPGSDANTERMRINSSGNVGIGTTSPSSKLEVYDSANSNTVTITSDGANEQFRIRRYSNTNEQLLFGVHSSDYSYIQAVEQGVAYRALSLNPNGGNVGIGVTNPNALLEVNKNVSFSTIDTYAQLVVKTTSGANGKLLNIGVDESAGLSFIQSVDRGTDSMPLILQRYSGNVGIGTTNPGAKLHVIGEVKSSTTTSTYGYISMQPGGDTVQGYVEWFKPGPTRVAYMGYNDGSSANNLGLQLENSANFIINGGNVGIGITSPKQKLDVNGLVAITNTNTSGYGELLFYENSSIKADIFVNGSSQTNYAGANSMNIWQGSNAPMAFYTNGTNERMRITSAGNVGIGTASPSYLLDVNGTARVTTLIETSAAKYKTNIQPLEPQLSRVTQLEPVTFDWIDKPNPKTNIGLIADEVEKIYPEFVSKTEDGEIEGIEYSKLTTVLIQSIKELKEIVDKQQEQINALLNK